MSHAIPEIPHLPPTQQDLIPCGFRRRLTVSVCFLFVVTMILFLAASFVSERNLHYRETFEHLDETLGVLAALLQGTEDPSPGMLANLEDLLKERTGVTHRVVLTDDDLSILVASKPELAGRDIRTSYLLTPYGSRGSAWSISWEGDKGWLASSTSLPPGTMEEGKIFLMRWRRSSEKFAGRFLGLHGLHVVVTLLLFIVLLHFLGVRYVRKPIEQLADHIQRVEGGDFKSIPERERDDEFGWLARRFTHLGITLKEMVQRLVRAEKYATVSILAFRIAREMKEPLEALNRHILYLENLANKDVEMTKIGATLRQDRQKVVDVIRRLNEIQPPEEGKA